MTALPIYLEIGEKRTFAAAVDWPGWCRSGGNAEAAIQTLAAYQQRYAAVLHAAAIAFDAPVAPAFVVREELTGNLTTDFGAPGIVPASDAAPVDEAELARLQAILQASWAAFDRAAAAAQGKALRTGPRGGGRNVEKMLDHLFDAELAYLSRLGFKHKATKGEAYTVALAHERAAALAGLAAAVRDGPPEQATHTKPFWPPRYFVRRAAWHILDHVWEIEDRIEL